MAAIDLLHPLLASVVHMLGHVGRAQPDTGPKLICRYTTPATPSGKYYAKIAQSMHTFQQTETLSGLPHVIVN